MSDHKWCVLDVETTGGRVGRFPRGCRLLVVGVLHKREVDFYEPRPEDMRRLVGFLNSCDTVVTFNGLRFDMPVLNLTYIELLQQPLSVAAHYDILDRLLRATGRPISLDRLARQNLGRGKRSWDHRQNQRVWQTDPQQLLEHNREDLELTSDIFQRIVCGKPLTVGNRVVSLPLPW